MNEFIKSRHGRFDPTICWIAKSICILNTSTHKYLTCSECPGPDIGDTGTPEPGHQHQPPSAVRHITTVGVSARCDVGHTLSCVQKRVKTRRILDWLRSTDILKYFPDRRGL